MKPDNLTIFGLFERQQRYVVPLFQRPYVWTRDKQWEALWENIRVNAELILEKGFFDPDLNRHFLGALVLNSERQHGFQVPIKLIIDGQQRITTMQIVLMALRDVAKSFGNNGMVNDITILNSNNLSNIREEEVFKVWPTNADQEVFVKLFGCGSKEKVNQVFPLYIPAGKRKPLPRPILVEAYLYYHDMIFDFVYLHEERNLPDLERDNDDLIQERLQAIYNAFLKLMEVVTIDLDEKDNPQVIFESLNYLGEPLLPSDLIRNFIFLEANRQGEAVKDLYDNYWYDYDRTGEKGQPGFWKNWEKQGRLRRPRMDLFIFHYLTFRKADEVIITRLYKEFQTWWRSEPNRSVHNELSELKDFSKIFRRFIQPDGNSKFDIFLERLRALDLSTVYPLLFFILANEKAYSTEDLNGIATDLESYLIRRLVCGLSPKNYNRFFLSLLIYLEKYDCFNRAELQKFLLEPSGDTGRWPNDREFLSKWISQPVYRTNRSRVPMILLALDREMLTSKQEEVHIGGSLTIEHILPQEYHEEHYPFLAGTGLDETQLTINRDEIIHTIGNLTLLTNKLNSSISNGSFARKKPEITKQSALRLNTYFQSDKVGNRWNEIDIEERARNLFKLALRIWPYPRVEGAS
jgi:uncharacterized protein with ParB-like and HNH nuclease domain